ncbi:MAG: hypothetical protein ABIQ40_07645 [Bacteroidia bacterium]
MKSIKLTGGIILALEFIYGTDMLKPKLNCMRNSKEGTVGYEVAKMLDKQRYRLIPKFENHDLKHIILDYEMTMLDEIRMQAYLVGNGNLTIACLVFLSLGFFYPKIWKDLPKEYRQGQISKSIHYLTLDYCMDKQLADIKNEYRQKIID